MLIRADEDARQLLWQRIVNRGLNQNFDVEIITVGHAQNSKPSTNLMRRKLFDELERSVEVNRISALRLQNDLDCADTFKRRGEFVR
ncbi:MAG: hypothetical protein IKD80_07245 [Selenomonadaceae bacterium]|nr:hypothetical protein [Selenomonadaceae bacterium]